ncbi:hypothetical protein RP20_CCG008711 [Aedes albopictus]|nr:hypothetical protein RP20_CCG008711 [Aedes albopictus]
MHDVGEDVTKPVVMHEDNQSCIAMLSSTGGGSRRTKHIDTRFNFVRELMSTDVMEVRYCPTDSMIADILTKPLARVKLERFRAQIGLKFFDVEEE